MRFQATMDVMFKYELIVMRYKKKYKMNHTFALGQSYVIHFDNVSGTRHET